MSKYDEEHNYKPLEFQPVQLDRYTVLLRDGETTATIYPIFSVNELPDGLLAFLCDEMNMEIEAGETSTFFEPLDLESFQNYWFNHFAAVMILGDNPRLEGPKQWEKECLGSFYIKPSYPGRSGHICTGSFIVNAGIRGKGIGRTMVDCYLQWSPRLGYTYSLFNLVFETNVPARRVLESTNFKRVGRVKGAGILKGHETAVDAIMYGRELVSNPDPSIGAYRFDKIKFYLETGRYPAMADRQEKSRLRSSSSHYRLENGKLMLKDKEVVADPVRQIQICTEYHLMNHGGINKTTSAVAEKYHWSRIKDTVAAAIKSCAECRDQSGDPTIVKRFNKPRTVPSTSTVVNNNPPNNRRIHKVIQSQPNNPNARIIKNRLQVDDIVHLRDESVLSSQDLSALDDNIIAAVEAAQRSQLRNANPQSYAQAAAQGSEFQYSNDYYKRQNDIPVDPDVEFASHKYDNREDLEIARALIQANEDNHDENEEDKDKYVL
ncbi:protein Spt10p [[Candida] jaroonii]|uniref:Protein Spt10p n=1 Tax=[Candida] jaroonii TaxID=467808 RepID=A0ACA9YA96_9ASCO|nr:protein Spt10p [[Candida] jaroonii]